MVEGRNVTVIFAPTKTAVKPKKVEVSVEGKPEKKPVATEVAKPAEVPAVEVEG